MPSKIIQFQIVTSAHNTNTLYALDEDGNLWFKNLSPNMAQGWHPVHTHETST